MFHVEAPVFDGLLFGCHLISLISYYLSQAVDACALTGLLYFLYRYLQDED